MPTAPDITLNLPLDQINALLALMGSHPYNQVADLITNIRAQAGQQIQHLQAGPMMAQRRNNGEDREFAS